MPRFRPALCTLDARLTPAGGLDLSWGVNGFSRVTPPAADGLYSLYALLPDGGAVAARGVFGGEPARLIRFTPAGVPDPGFGTNGAADLPGVGPQAVVGGPAGTVYVLGTRSSEYVLVRLTAAGGLDPAFGGDGVVDLGPAGGAFFPVQLSRRPDGGVWVGDQSAVRVALVRPDGGFDPARDLFVAPLLPGLSYANQPDAIRYTATPDGGLLAVSGGWVTPADNPIQAVTVVTKLTAAGQVGLGYGTGGRVILSAPQSYYQVTPTPDGGAAVLVGMDRPLGPDEFSGIEPWLNRGSPVGLARLTPTGELDTTYAGDGAAELERPGDSGVLSVVPLADGRVALVQSDNGRVAVRAFTPDGRPDAGVGDGGSVVPDLHGIGSFGGQFVAAGVGDRLLLRGIDVFGPDGRDYQTVTAVLDLSADTPAGATRPVTPGDPAPLPVIVAAPPENHRTDDVPVVPVVLPICPPSADPVETVSSRPPVAGDLNRDGVADKVVTDGPMVGVVSGADGRVLLPAFAPFEASYTGPLNAVLADVDGDGTSELVVSPDQGGGPVVAVYRRDGSQAGRFFGIDDGNFRGGARLAAGDLNADGAADLVVTAGDGGGPRVALFDGRTIGATPRRLVGDFFAFEEAQRGGAFAAVSDGRVVLGAGPGGGPRIRTVDAAALLSIASPTLDALPASARLDDRFVADPATRTGAKVTLVADTTMVMADAGGRAVPVLWGSDVVPPGDDLLRGLALE